MTVVKTGWGKDLAAGGSVALYQLPAVLGTGVILVAPLGPGWLPAGILGAFAATILGALVRGLSGGPLHISAPRPAQAAMLAALMVSVAAEPVVQSLPETSRFPLILAAGLTALTLAGGLQILLGLLRLGVIIRFIPFPLVAGLSNGFAIAIALGQMPAMVGGQDWSQVAIHPLYGALCCGTIAALATLAGPRLIKAVPGGLTGLVAGCAAYAGLAWVWPEMSLGPLVGALPDGLPFVWSGGAMMDLTALPGFFTALAPLIVTSAAIVATVSSLQSLVSLAAADALTQQRSDGNRELILQGAGNVTAGLAGGTVIGGSPLYTRIALDNGAHGRGAQVAMALALLAMVLGLGEVIGKIPVAVMAGVVVATAIATLDPWSIRLLRRVLHARSGAFLSALDLAVVVVVMVLVVTNGALTALAVGMLASILGHLGRASGGTLRRSVDATQVRSETARSAPDQAVLDREGGAIRLLTVQGAVFFGSAEALADRIEAEATATTVILDLSRVSDIDSTGLQVLKRIDRGLTKAGRQLLLAGLPAAQRRFLPADLGWGADRCRDSLFEDANAALTAAEDRLLAERHPDEADELSLAVHPVLRGLTESHLDLLATVAERHSVPAGTMILTEGAPAEAVWLLVQGRAQAVRGGLLVSGFRRGAVFGERALLGPGPYRDSVVASEALVAYRLLSVDLDMLGRIDGRIPLILTRNVLAAATAQNDRMSALIWE